MSKTFFLNIDSNDCSGDFHTFTYILRDTIIRGYKAFFIKSAEITNLFPSFSSRDNKFYYYKKINDVETLRTITISLKKSYSGDLLIQDLNAGLLENTDNIDCSFTFDNTTGLLTFHTTNLYKVISISEAEILNLSSTANYRMGFTESSYSYTTLYTSDIPIYLLSTKCVYVKSNLCDYETETSNRYIDKCFLKMQLNSGFGFISYFVGGTTYDLVVVDRKDVYISSINFSLWNDNGEPIDLNGGSFSISITFILE